MEERAAATGRGCASALVEAFKRQSIDSDEEDLFHGVTKYDKGLGLVMAGGGPEVVLFSDGLYARSWGTPWVAVALSAEEKEAAAWCYAAAQPPASGAQQSEQA